MIISIVTFILGYILGLFTFRILKSVKHYQDVKKIEKKRKAFKDKMDNLMK